jgi:hypothetical protein
MNNPAFKEDGLPVSPALDPSVRQARHALAMRASRHDHFPDILFGEPAWDLLLHLYIAEAERRQLSVEQCLNLSTAPATTTTRWIRLMVEHELVIHDSAGEALSLTASARQALKAFLRQFAETWPNPAWRRPASRAR